MSRGAPPQATSLFPAGGQVGQEVTIQAAGTFDPWPVQVWCSTPEVTVEPGQKPGQFALKLPADLPAQRIWLRFYNAQGASGLRPFLIGQLPEIAEKEPNELPKVAGQLPADGVVVNGRLGKSGDVDQYAIHLSAGQTLVAGLEGNRLLGAPMDAIMQLVSSQGFVLVQSDDERGLDPLLEFTASQEGTYYLRLFGFPAVASSSVAFAGGDDFVYRLTATTGPLVWATLPLAVQAGHRQVLELQGWNLSSAARQFDAEVPAEATSFLLPAGPTAAPVELPVFAGAVLLEDESLPVEKPQSLVPPACVSGLLQSRGDVDRFAVSLTKGQRLRARAVVREMGFPGDPLLVIRDVAGKIVSQADDQGTNRDADLLYVATADGTYLLELRDLAHEGGPRYLYRLTVELAAAGFGAKVAADAFTLAAGKPLAIPVTIDRVPGMVDEIEVSVEGLPAGLTAAPVVSSGKGATAKTVTLSVERAADFQQAVSAPLRIVARSRGSAPMEQRAVAPLAAFSTSTDVLWITAPAP